MALRGLAIPVFVMLALFPVIGSDYWTGQLTRYLIFGLFAISLSLVWGRGGILCFGQAMFFGLGGYVMAVCTLGMAGPVLQSSYLALIVAMIVVAAFAALLGYFLFWGRGLHGAYLAIVTLAISYILEQAIKSWYALGADNGLIGVPPLNLGAFGFELELWAAVPRFYLVLGLTVLVYGLLDRLLASPFGLVLSATKGDPDRVASFGYAVLRVRLTVFVIGAVVAGLAGALFVAVDEFASPTLIGFGLSTEVLIWVALGGKEMLIAAFLGAIAVRLMEGYFAELLGDYWILALGTVFMATVVLFPRGLIATPLERLLAVVTRPNEGHR